MKAFYFFVITLTRFVFKVFYRMRVYGREHYFKGGAILAPNHVSYFDPPIVAAASPESIHFLARETLFRSWFGKMIAALNSHPVQGHVNNIKAIKTICGLLKKGYKMILFPEGTRSKDNTLGEIKPGIGMLVSRSETAIIPVYVHGTYKIWPRSRKFPRLFGRTAVVFGSPIHWKDYTDMDKKEAQEHIAQRLTTALEELRKWYENGAQGNPP
ncbi:lysophospholipid acyltransferase family protein [Simkania sp.]|uniref:lysophospholipid acyltransferase family protein n=1 Tax=Simkania sp. TaxID=34094 RepID=UPI003B517571